MMLLLAQQQQRVRQRRIEREQARAERERQNKISKLELKRKQAEVKAKELLMDIIGEKELEVYEKTGRVLVKGRENDYIIRKGGIVQKVMKDKVQDICIHLRDRYALPETDNVISLMLLAKADEEELDQIGNKHRLQPRPEEFPECANF